MEDLPLSPFPSLPLTSPSHDLGGHVPQRGTATANKINTIHPIRIFPIFYDGPGDFFPKLRISLVGSRPYLITRFLWPHESTPTTASRFTKYLMIILRLFYDIAKITIDLLCGRLIYQTSLEDAKLFLGTIRLRNCEIV